MDISKKALIITFIIDLLLIAVGVVCMVVLKFNVLSLCLFLALSVLVLVSSILIWKFGKAYKK